jgi:hypothetical protein
VQSTVRFLIGSSLQVPQKHSTIVSCLPIKFGRLEAAGRGRDLSDAAVNRSTGGNAFCPMPRNSKGIAIMRGHFVCGVTILTIIPTIALGASDAIPTLDVRPVCRGIASQSSDPGVGEKNQNQAFQQCLESEQAVRDQLKQKWSDFSAADKRHCVTLATTGGESSNTELLTCLEMARDVRLLRSAYSGAAATKPAPSPAPPQPPPPPTPAAQPAAAVPNPDKEIPKSQDDAKSEVERAKLEAQTAKTSEAAVQRKLADTEAALRKAKDDAQRASADLERAKSEAQNARASEAVIKQKLADAEVARVKAEQACHGGDDTQPTLRERFRRWLGKPGTSNP